MSQFKPCTSMCTYEGTHCEGCGRSHQEIADTKQAIGAVVEFAKQQGYENIEEFSAYVGSSVLKKLQIN